MYTMRLLIIVLLLLPILRVAAQPKRTYQFSESFTRVSVFGPFKVTLVPSDKNELILNYEKIDPDDVVTEIDDDRLVLKMRNRKYLDDWRENRGSDYVNVILHYNSLDEISVKAGAVVSNESFLVSRNLLIESDMGAQVNLNVKAKNLYIKCNMGSDNRITGKTDLMDIKAGMGSMLNAGDLAARSCFIKASMGAEVKVQVTEELVANASMGAVVHYNGNPVKTDFTTALGGEVLSRNR